LRIADFVHDQEGLAGLLGGIGKDLSGKSLRAAFAVPHGVVSVVLDAPHVGDDLCNLGHQVGMIHGLTSICFARFAAFRARLASALAMCSASCDAWRGGE